MKYLSTPYERIRHVAVAALCVSFVAPCVLALAHAPVPAALVPPDTEQVAFTWQAVGTQIYECRAGKAAAGASIASGAASSFAWVFVAPQADLLNAAGDKVGTHGAGPYWAALDGSKTVGTVKARAEANAHVAPNVGTPRAADIPLLLLSTQSTGGPGKMAKITSIQRLNTHGGVAPASGCQTQADVGQQSQQGYTADYVFFAPK